MEIRKRGYRIWFGGWDLDLRLGFEFVVEMDNTDNDIISLTYFLTMMVNCTSLCKEIRFGSFWGLGFGFEVGI